jgi:hypothetical protein
MKWWSDEDKNEQNAGRLEHWSFWVSAPLHHSIAPLLQFFLWTKDYEAN